MPQKKKKKGKKKEEEEATPCYLQLVQSYSMPILAA